MRFSTNIPDASNETQPVRVPAGLASYQPIRISLPPEEIPIQSARKRGCSVWYLILLLLVLIPPVVYFIAPLRTNFLVLGIDGGLSRGDLGRTDTIILATVNPLQPNVGMLSIPRDLWVPVEGIGENRINTAYFFAEAQEPGSGSLAAMHVIAQNFKVPVGYYLVVRMDGLLSFIDSMGGVDVTLEKDAAGLNKGNHHLDGEQALRFARSRAGTDDFSRMGQAQVLVKAVIQRMLQPDVWPRLPEIISSSQTLVDMNIPTWQWPRLAFAVLRLGPGNIITRSITREMVQPFTTAEGAQVLLPDWDAIGVITKEMFGK